MITSKSLDKKYHYLYKIIRGDGKFYIGVHSTNDLNDSYFGSGKYLKASIKKYGKDFHCKEILEFHSSRQSLLEREKIIVNSSLLKEVKCMNIIPGGGGGGGIPSETTRSKMREKSKELREKGIVKSWANTLSEKQRKLGNINSKIKQGALHQYSQTGDFIKTWSCKDEVVNTLKISKSTLMRALRDQNVICCSFFWSRRKVTKLIINLESVKTRSKWEKRGNSKPIFQLNQNNQIVKEWDSISLAGRHFGNRHTIDRSIKTGCLAFGFYFSFGDKDKFFQYSKS